MTLHTWMMKITNNKQQLGWESLLNSAAPKGCALAAALFTTYDRADERLLVEYLLPELLQLNHEPDGEAAEQKYFYLELDDRLKQLHGRIVVVSSTLREEASAEEANPGDGSYGWIWRSIRHLTVGKTGQAVQHAKLWLLHWTHSDGDQYLEIVVSSANLTLAAFKQQIQSAWRVCLLLAPEPAISSLSNWGVLPGFMRALALSSGDDTHIERFIGLLGRADCPSGISFVASVPGKHLQTAPWGSAGLRNIVPAGRGAVKAWVLAPFVGVWTAESLQRWCTQFAGAPKGLSLVWIGKAHPWVQQWLLPLSSLKHLTAAGSTLVQLPVEPNKDKRSGHFHDEHRSSDERWSHAKVYALRRGNSKRLILTSANFSQAAWGQPAPNGDLTIENFELGVCIEQADWPFEHLKQFGELQEVATSADVLRRSRRLISWAQASWDGKRVLLECKCQTELDGQVLSASDPLPITCWKTGENSMFNAQIRWTDTELMPKSVVLKCSSETLNVPVFDDRPLTARETSFPDEVSEADVQAMRDKLIFERYGGNAATDDETDLTGRVEGVEANPIEGNPCDSGHDDSYAVASFVTARQHLQIVDTWARRYKQAQHGASEFVLDMLKRDGGLLVDAFKRQIVLGGDAETGAKLAAEELALRLNQVASDLCCP